MSFPRYPAYKPSGVEWLGEVPEHWEMGQSRRRFRLRNEPTKEEDEQLTASQKHGIIRQAEFIESEGRRVVEVIKGQDILKHVEPGDFVISMRSFQGGLEYSEVRGCISSAYVMLAPVKQVIPTFFSWLFKSQPYIQALQSTTNLVRDGQALRFSNFCQVDIPIIPPNEQLAIATFLDHENAKIDALIAEQQRLIELLQEKRQAVISHAVTKGLNPHAPMKDSGVEWLGEVPEHWSLVKLKHVAKDKVAGPYGASLTKSMYTHVGYRVYGQQQVIPDNFEEGDYYIDDDKYEEMRRYSVSPGDVLISVMGTVGKVAVVPDCVEPGIINPRLVRYHLRDLLIPRFAQRLLLSTPFQEKILLEAKGATMDGLNMQILGDLPLPLPPRAEQEAILDQLLRAMASFDAMASSTEQSVLLLKERRSALISAAVTGQIDVRGLVPEVEAA